MSSCLPTPVTLGWVKSVISYEVPDVFKCHSGSDISLPSPRSFAFTPVAHATILRRKQPAMTLLDDDEEDEHFSPNPREVL